MAEKSRAEVFDFGPFRLDAAQGILLRYGERAALVPKAVELLTLLVQRGGSVVGKQELLDALWPDVVVEEGNLAKLVHLLRRELGADGIIETVPKLVGELRSAGRRHLRRAVGDRAGGARAGSRAHRGVRALPAGPLPLEPPAGAFRLGRPAGVVQIDGRFVTSACTF